jgi:hypothetical protein
MSRLIRRLRSEERGFGLFELVAAIGVLSIGILALVAAFNAGAMALQRSARVSTATVLAERQLELYRALKYSEIGLVPALVTTAETNAAYLAGWPYLTVTAPAVPASKELSCTDATRISCQPMQTVTGPDGRSYRLDTYIVQHDFDDLNGATPALRKLKVVRVLVRDGSALDSVLVSQESSFDESNGL